jgi:hypothetical protein
MGYCTPVVRAIKPSGVRVQVGNFPIQDADPIFDLGRSGQHEGQHQAGGGQAGDPTKVSTRPTTKASTRATTKASTRPGGGQGIRPT